MLLGVALAVVGLKAAMTGSGGRSEVRDLALGESATTSLGNEVAVLAWHEQATAKPDLSEVTVRACRSQADQPLLSAASLSLEMPDGKTFEPAGSKLNIEGDCISGAIFFPDTKGTAPRSATYHRGSPALRWPLDGR